MVLTFPDYSSSLREVRAGAEAEVMEEGCLLVCSYMDGSACILLCPRTTTCTEVAPHNWLAPLMSVIMKMHYRLAYRQISWGTILC